MKISGGCFCGAVQYEADIDENRIGVCHCRDCQKFSGSAFRLAAATMNFSFTQGTPKHFEKTADTGKIRRMAFCGECGTHLCSQPGDPDAEGAYISVRIATAENFHEISPIRELFCDSRVPWLSPIDTLAQFPRMPQPSMKD